MSDHTDRRRPNVDDGDHQVVLPVGVTAADWALERKTSQNPRIRAFLGCIHLLEGVLESNYAILHCSPDRLREIWRRVRQVSEAMETKLAPLLKIPSCIPQLEAARYAAEEALALLARGALADLGSFAEETPSDPQGLLEVRKILCISIGKLHAFLQDAFGETLAADPRGLHDADYYSSKRFPRDIEEAEWLYASVSRLAVYLTGIEVGRVARLVPLLVQARREETVPRGESWEEARRFLATLIQELTPRLKEVLALRGIRFYEMEVLDRHAVGIPDRCQVVLALQEAAVRALRRIEAATGRSRVARQQAIRDLLVVDAAFAARLVRELKEIDESLQDLVVFVPIWRDSIRNRRALFLKQAGAVESEDAEAGEDGTASRDAPGAEPG